MDQFKLHSEYQPTGDQPETIAELVRGGFRRVTSSRCFSGSRVPARPLPWQAS